MYPCKVQVIHSRLWHMSDDHYQKQTTLATQCQIIRGAKLKYGIIFTVTKCLMYTCIIYNIKLASIRGGLVNLKCESRQPPQ